MRAENLRGRKSRKVRKQTSEPSVEAKHIKLHMQVKERCAAPDSAGPCARQTGTDSLHRAARPQNAEQAGRNDGRERRCTRLVLDCRCERQVVKHIRDVFPDVCASILSEALVVEPIHLRGRQNHPERVSSERDGHKSVAKAAPSPAGLTLSFRQLATQHILSAVFRISETPETPGGAVPTLRRATRARRQRARFSHLRNLPALVVPSKEEHSVRPTNFERHHCTDRLH